ncbi:Succinate-semialdehyde dehydrogenase, mitochondrial [Cyanidiococcus yangmingshanensis]|uniref:Succinate-semialdehyde dehydrogenase, mitochondrial n=1 Tax=Cyanidiococcus yangmingshanensis TaxID=2690220 RepID=A0A7J7IQ29_9RHOD|nr:Succinate-semialdehyde dehydrogenase, mitochondrial [Cyanidiococcus yangmingshanensis]
MVLVRRWCADRLFSALLRRTVDRQRVLRSWRPAMSMTSASLPSRRLSSALSVGALQPAPEDLYIGHYINGQQVLSDSYYRVIDPANGNTVAFVADGDEQTIEEAVEAAKAAFPSWRETSPQVRGNLLRRWYELIIEHREVLGRTITRENGKPLSEAIGEARYAASFVEWFAGEAPRVYGDVVPATSGPRQALVVREPLGVCAAITPWNFPCAMLTRKSRASTGDRQYSRGSSERANSCLCDRPRGTGA